MKMPAGQARPAPVPGHANRNQQHCHRHFHSGNSHPMGRVSAPRQARIPAMLCAPRRSRTWPRRQQKDADSSSRAPQSEFDQSTNGSIYRCRPCRAPRVLKCETPYETEYRTDFDHPRRQPAESVSRPRRMMLKKGAASLRSGRIRPRHCQVVGRNRGRQVAMASTL